MCDLKIKVFRFFKYRESKPAPAFQKIFLAMPSAGYLFRMYSNAFRYVPISRFEESLGLRLRHPTISSYFLRSAVGNMLYLPPFHSIPRPIPRCIISFIYCSRVFRNSHRLNRVVAPTCRRIDRVSHCSSGFALSQLSFRNSERVARRRCCTSLYKSCIFC